MNLRLSGAPPAVVEGGARRVIIDTDPGVDDAMALLLAMRSPELKIEAITPVAGNVPLHLGAAERLANGRSGRPRGHSGGPGRARPAPAAVGHLHLRPRLERPRRRRVPSTEDQASGGDSHRNHPSHRERRSGRGVDCCSRAADQRRCCASGLSFAGPPNPRNRSDGRIALRRQHDTGGGVQYVCRSGGRQYRLPLRCAGDHGGPRCH